MTGMARVLGGLKSRSGKWMIVTGTVMTLFLGLPGIFPGEAGQGFARALGSPRNVVSGTSKNSAKDQSRQISKANSAKSDQKQTPADNNFKQLKKHAKHLKALAGTLKKEIDKSNPNVLSLEIVRKAEEVQKLAKTIEDEAKPN